MFSSSSMEPDVLKLKYLINHLFLPPQLPQESDWSQSNHISILSLIEESIQSFTSLIQTNNTDNRVSLAWDTLRHMIHCMSEMRTDPSLDLSAILKRTVCEMKTNEVLCIHIVAQNAGVILRRFPDETTFEVFQASPPAAEVSRTIGKLVMTFPVMPRLAFPNNEQCITAFCNVLAWLDCTEMPDAIATTKKAGRKTTEAREVTDIHYLSQILGSILATGTTANIDDTGGKTVYVTKRINDHVLWNSAFLPWRRMPEWLILRVAFQTTLKDFGIDEDSSHGYKLFITYVLANLLQKACRTNEISHELLHVMNIKIGNRMWKLRDTVTDGPVFDFIHEQVAQCRRIMQKRWDKILADEKLSSRFSPSINDILAAHHFTFPNSGDYLSKVYSRRSTMEDGTTFDQLSFESSIRPNPLRIIGNWPPERFKDAPDTHEFWLAVVDFEQWMTKRMHEWRQITEPWNQLEILRGYIEDLIKLKDKIENPELFSRLFLIVLELWVALDKATISISPLLTKYSPELTIESFEPLLLPHLSQLKRLTSVEIYISGRETEAKCHTSIFDFKAEETTFAYQYFQLDQGLQSLRRKIFIEASSAREEKLRQWKRLQEEYHELVARSDILSHTTFTNRRGWKSHDRFCEKCSLSRRASDLSIEVFEWPLPEDEILQQLVVFELALPRWFATWRTITYDIAVTYGNQSRSTAKPAIILKDYKPLMKYVTSNEPGITISSPDNMPWYKSHHRKIAVRNASWESDVVKPHPLRYKLYHQGRNQWIKLPFLISIRDNCTPVLAGYYENLSWMIHSTAHTSNMVIANQSDCPRLLTYHEWESFGHLRAGARLQWRNILIEFIKGVGTFRDPAWFLLFRQAAWQAESAAEDIENVYRDCHTDLANESFAAEALEILATHYVSICENWQESWTAMSLVILTCRIHSLNKNQNIRATAFDLLSRLRETCWLWLKEVQELYRRRCADEGQNDLLYRLIQIAVCCRSTYALELEDLRILFSQDPNSVEVFAASSVVLQTYLPASFDALPSTLRYIVQKDLVQSAEAVLCFTQLIISDRVPHIAGFSNAVVNFWDGFRPDHNTWEFLHYRWLHCRTLAENSNDQARFIYLNILDGQLLIDGKTLGNLPKSILGSVLYKWIFPKGLIAATVPSTLKRMSYQLAQNINGTQEVHFHQGKELIICTRDTEKNGAISEFVENSKLRGDFPEEVLRNSIILYHDAIGKECSRLRFYERSPEGWNLRNLPSWEMDFSEDPSLQCPGPTMISTPRDLQVSTNSAVLSPRSKLVNRAFAVLSRLESSPEELFVLWESNNSCLSHCPTSCLLINLPRYSLTFFLNSSRRLECKEFSSMLISHTQSIGTLVGLRNKLILEDSRHPRVMKIIIPYGEVHCQSIDGQVSCHIDSSASIINDHIRFSVYDVDLVLQRLTSTETLAAWYFLIYLHAVTSYHMPDPFTGRCGTQQALEMLSSSNSFAFMEPLRPQELNVLQKIKELTPTRQYCPAHLTSMESVVWRPDISYLSQNDLFVPFVDALLQHNADLTIFQEDGKPIYESRTAPINDGNLRRRSERRTLRNVAAEYVPEDELDQVYQVSLENRQLSPDQARLSEVTMLVKHWIPSLKSLPKLWDFFSSSDPFVAKVEPFHFANVRDCVARSAIASDVWFGFFEKCCDAEVKERNFYDILFIFPIIAYKHQHDMDALYLLITMASQAAVLGRQFREVPGLVGLPTSEDPFTPKAEGYRIERNQLHHLVKFQDYYTFEEECDPYEGPEKCRGRCERHHSRACGHQREQLLDIVVTSSSLSTPFFPSSLRISGLDVFVDFMETRKGMEMKFRAWSRNLLLLDYCSRLDKLFQRIPLSVATAQILPWSPTLSIHPTTPRFKPFTLMMLIEKRPVDNWKDRITNSNSTSIRCLEENLRRLTRSDNLLQSYCDDLSECIDALSQNNHDIPLETFQRCILNPKGNLEQLLFNAGLWPTINPCTLLKQLSYPLRHTFLNHDWLETLTQFGETLRRIQSKNRQDQTLVSSASTADLNQDSRWKSMEYLDWLLIELDADIMIRPVQVKIAEEMMSPVGKTNTVVQLNMGEGKSSVIIPIISTTLADGKQLVRVMVLKPLCRQMFHLLRQRICGLANRRLYFFPFHRGVSLDRGKIDKIFSLFRKCAETGGILVCQPEHILSFRLIGLEMLCTPGKEVKSECLLNIQRWLDKNSRDILDESDELLSTRYQLVYTIGTALPLDGQPQRWEIVQKLFSLIEETIPDLQARYNDGLEISWTAVGAFTRIRLLTTECAQALVETLGHEIIYKERLPWLLLRTYTAADRESAFKFITTWAIKETNYRELKLAFPYNFPHLLLLRGLLGMGILVNVLKEKRWRVDYGLHLSRCLVAVPYRAKDYPSLRAEFGHPEIIITLTCLSYYYNGLRDVELERVFELLFQTDNPDAHYEEWIKEQRADIPIQLRTLRGLNLEDAELQRTVLFPRLRYVKGVIDFYLGKYVFPREAKEFPFKLTTNSWDLAMTKRHFTTGFSGTNDHRYLLPLSIKQADSPDQKHTNALVLDYILRPENRKVLQTGSNPDATTLLQFVVQQKSQILIDAGAQILELDNEEVARRWLALDQRSQIEAAIYCDMKDEEFKVISRKGRTDTLQNSPYKVQLEKTVVFLDEARTRGTDFRFPPESSAVVTLGPKLVKDKLMQACMRMRQLGRSHSVMFFASDEIVEKIRKLLPNSVNDMDSYHVLLWSMHETILQLKNHCQHWAIQGLNYRGRCQAWEQYVMDNSTERLSAIIAEQEAKTLEELYGCQSIDGMGSSDFVGEEIVKRCTCYGVNISSLNNIAEEQERELSHEKEAEREVERITKAKPLPHSLDPALRAFIEEGTPEAHKFQTLADSLQYASGSSELSQITKTFFRSKRIVCTTDFARTIELLLLSPGVMNDFLRPVQWVLSSTAAPDFLCIISPFEANTLFSKINDSKTMVLCCYTPRTSLHRKSTEGLDKLVLPRREPNRNVICTPASIQELNLYAGQLFFENKEAFALVCRMLGLYLGDISPDLEGKIDVTGFVESTDLRTFLGMVECKFRLNPVNFLQALFSWRGKGQGYVKTHMWKILHGRNVEDKDF